MESSANAKCTPIWDQSVEMYFVRISMMLYAFIYIFFIFFLPAINILSLMHLEYEQQIAVLCTSAAIQVVLSIRASFLLGIACYESDQIKDSKISNEYCNNIWCGSFTDEHNLFGLAHIMYFLPQWFVINVAAMNIVQKNIYVALSTKLFVWMPLAAFVLFFFMGVAYAMPFNKRYMGDSKKA